MERMKCRFCKHFAENGLTAWGMQQYKCTLHNIGTCLDACGCDWCNSNDNRCGSGADECGSIKNREYITLWKGNAYLRIAYYIAEYAGRWFYSVDVERALYGSMGYPNIHQHSYETRQIAVDNAMQDLIRLAECNKDAEMLNICKQARFDSRQLSLF